MKFLGKIFKAISQYRPTTWEEHYLSKSTDYADFVARMKIIERGSFMRPVQY